MSPSDRIGVCAVGLGGVVDVRPRIPRWRRSPTPAPRGGASARARTSDRPPSARRSARRSRRPEQARLPAPLSGATMVAMRPVWSRWWWVGMTSSMSSMRRPSRRRPASRALRASSLRGPASIRVSGSSAKQPDVHRPDVRQRRLDLNRVLHVGADQLTPGRGRTESSSVCHTVKPRRAQPPIRRPNNRTFPQRRCTCRSRNWLGQYMI